MYPANAYVIREATHADEQALRQLAELNGNQPLRGRVLIGEIEGEPAAAASIDDGRIVSHPQRPTHLLVPLIGMRARAQRTFERMPSLTARLAAGLA
ncbi:MAG TPA: hypothetical protein VHR40_13310 [Thermoleophilaceae bacterium]|jgi:hypothetical protein|nr:hypothetical protein [Thermoleophilaceae bacterium]